MVGFFLITYIFFCFFINIFDNIFILQTTILGYEPNSMELFVETHMRSHDRQKKVQQFVDSQAQHFVVCWFSTIFFFSYYLLEFDEFIFSCQETYNSRLKERYGNDTSTHLDIDLDLWLEAGSSGKPDTNRVYGLSNTTAENVWTTHSISTIESSQSVLTTQTPKFTTLLDRVQKCMVHLNEKYKQLNVDYQEL